MEEDCENCNRTGGPIILAVVRRNGNGHIKLKNGRDS